MYICASVCVFKREGMEVGERRPEKGKQMPCSTCLEEPYVTCVTPLCKSVTILYFCLITALSLGGWKEAFLWKWGENPELLVSLLLWFIQHVHCCSGLLDYCLWYCEISSAYFLTSNRTLTNLFSSYILVYCFVPFRWGPSIKTIRVISFCWSGFLTESQH